MKGCPAFGRDTPSGDPQADAERAMRPPSSRALRLEFDDRDDPVVELGERRSLGTREET